MTNNRRARVRKGRAEHLLRKAQSNVSLLSGNGVNPFVEDFEGAFARANTAEWALALSSGTAALHTALLACDIGPGDEVIVSPYGWGQTVAAVLYAGATPVFADIDPDTLALDPVSVGQATTTRTKAILVTHMCGLPADMKALEALAKESGTRLIADAAQALGAEIDGRPIGALGDCTVFSLGRGKAVSGGEGGVLVTSDEELFHRALLVSQHPLRCWQDVMEPSLRSAIGEAGLTYRIHPLAAALAHDSLDCLPETLAARREEAARIAMRLAGAPGLRPLKEQSGTRAAYYSLPLTFDAAGAEDTRNRVAQEYQESGIPLEIGPVKRPLPMRPPFSGEAWVPKLLRVCSRHPSWTPECWPLARQRCEWEEMVVPLSRIAGGKRTWDGTKDQSLSVAGALQGAQE